jgi:glycosyltransferase involved in cell wall biosynthesis
MRRSEALQGPGPVGGTRLIYISWAQSCSRSDHTARELGGRSHTVYLRRFGSRPSTIVFKYIGQWVKTLRILRTERPDTVFVMTPPLVAALPAFWYARGGHARVVLDAHTAAFLHPRWRRFQWLQRALFRRAVTTLVHNAHLADVVRAAGGHTTLVPDVPIVFQNVEPFPRAQGFTVGVVCSFNSDEPLGAIWDAAVMLPDVHFYVTGDPRDLPSALAARQPANLHLTGFLSVPAYGGLLSSADVVLTLTTRDHTMLRGAYEAIYQGTPVVVSDWPVLREAFPEGSVYADNTAPGIVDAIRTVQRNAPHYRAGAGRLRDLKRRRWEQTRDLIESRLRASDSNETLRSGAAQVSEGK